MPSVMIPHWSRWGAAFVATCPDCGSVCGYWDDDDLDEHGNLLCWHD
jgi:hypothetical protein